MAQAERTRVLTLVSPMPAEWWPKLWSWLQEQPDANLDDYSPRTYDEFADEMIARTEAGERSWGVEIYGHPVGAIGYKPLTPRLGMFHGICFTREACGTGIARAAVREVLDTVYAEGVEKVCAYFLADNRRVGRFFQKLGAVTEGVQVAQTMQLGKRKDLKLVALFNPKRRG
jgi:RimJ/RimL family protein N-acetyltransferase